MKNLNFYQVDMKYIRDLTKADDKVMSISPQNHKESRPFVGVIVICDDKQYCVPLTSPKPKHQTMNNREDFSRIVDDNGKILGALNFNNMIPVSKSVITPIDIRPRHLDSPSECGRKKILNIQLDWCNKNKELISRKANKLYHLVTETPDKFRNLTRRCCDFKKLETVLEKRLSKSSLENTANKLFNENIKLQLENAELSMENEALKKKLSQAQEQIKEASSISRPPKLKR